MTDFVKINTRPSDKQIFVLELMRTMTVFMAFFLLGGLGTIVLR